MTVRWFHYTLGIKLPHILAAGMIRRARAGVSNCLAYTVAGAAPGLLGEPSVLATCPRV